VTYKKKEKKENELPPLTCRKGKMTVVNLDADQGSGDEKVVGEHSR